jgi:hypothetical protein
MAIDLHESFIDDIRQPVAGDSYGWAALEPTTRKTQLVIHHSASNSLRNPGEDGYSIANYHVNSNGWGGVGYHFVIRHDRHPKGAGVEYVGDLGTWRAHVLNQNPGKVGICLAGNFSEEVPGRRQLELTRQLIDFFIAPNNILPTIENYSQVVGHRDLMATACPGDGRDAWFGYLRGAGFPSHLYDAPAPPAPVVFQEVHPEPIVETVPEPTPVVEYVEPEEEVNVIPIMDAEKPEHETSYTVFELPRDQSVTEDTQAVDFSLHNAPHAIENGKEVRCYGQFTFENRIYYRVLQSVSGSFYGVPVEAFGAPGQVKGVPNMTFTQGALAVAAVGAEVAKSVGWVRRLIRFLLDSLRNLRNK